MPGSPSGSGQLDREAIQRAFQGLADRLAERGVRAHVYLFGGAAMAMAYRRGRTTLDVDALTIDHREAVLAAADVVRDQALDPEWLDEFVRAGQIRGPTYFLIRPISSLRVRGRALTVQAGREADRDDIQSLLRHLGIRSMQEVREIHGGVYPRDAIPLRNTDMVHGELRAARQWRRGHAVAGNATAVQSAGADRGPQGANGRELHHSHDDAHGGEHWPAIGPHHLGAHRDSSLDPIRNKRPLSG